MSEKLLVPINKLIPHLGRLRVSLLPEMSDERYHAVAANLDMLPFSLGAAKYAYEEGIRAQHIVVGSIAADLDRDTRYHPGPAQRDRLAFPIDSFLEAARRAQNALVHYISRAHRIGLKQSLSDVMKEVYSGRLKLESPLPEILTAYWDNHGQRLKEYRDLSQHHSIVSSNTSVFVADDGAPCFQLLLPNNPGVKDTSKLEWGAPPVHAYLYVRSQFSELIQFVYLVTRHLVEQFPIRQKPNGTFTATLTGQTLRQPIVIGGDKSCEGQKLFAVERIAGELEQLPNVAEKRYRSLKGGEGTSGENN